MLKLQHPADGCGWIDEAAAVKLAGYWRDVNARTTGTEGLRNMARAALAWRARAESAEADVRTLQSTVEYQANRIFSAEAERDSLRRQLAQAVKAR